MSNIEKAKELLASDGYTCVLCRGDTVYTSRDKGISPMLDFIDGGISLEGFSAADKIVGKAAAMLFVLAGVDELFAEVLSKNAADVLEKYGIAYTFGTMTDIIINRKGNGICPMEEATADIDDPAEAFIAVKNKRDKLRKENI